MIIPELQNNFYKILTGDLQVIMEDLALIYIPCILQTHWNDSKGIKMYSKKKKEERERQSETCKQRWF
jgi:hypothetical protein